jgi:hypothetical protein
MPGFGRAERRRCERCPVLVAAFKEISSRPSQVSVSRCLFRRAYMDFQTLQKIVKPKSLLIRHLLTKHGVRALLVIGRPYRTLMVVVFGLLHKDPCIFFANGVARKKQCARKEDRVLCKRINLNAFTLQVGMFKSKSWLTLPQLLLCEGAKIPSQSLVASISTMMIESLRREGNDTTTQLLVARCANIE